MSEHTAENGLYILATYCGRGPCWKGAGHEGPCEPGSQLDPRRNPRPTAESAARNAIKAEALREAAAEWASEYDRLTREKPHTMKTRAAYRLASVLAGQRADQLTHITPSAKTDRGATSPLHALFAALTVAAFWSSHWIGYWSGALVVAVAFAWVAGGVATLPKPERPRPPMGGRGR